MSSCRVTASSSACSLLGNERYMNAKTHPSTMMAIIMVISIILRFSLAALLCLILGEF